MHENFFIMKKNLVRSSSWTRKAEILLVDTIHGIEMASAAMKFEFTAGKIWCLVTQPDACCFSFRLREDAKGQDLLDAVLKFLHFSRRSKSIPRKAQIKMKL